MATITSIELAHAGRSYRCTFTGHSPAGDSFVMSWAVDGIPINAVSIPERLRLEASEAAAGFNYRVLGKL